MENNKEKTLNEVVEDYLNGEVDYLNSEMEQWDGENYKINDEDFYNADDDEKEYYEQFFDQYYELSEKKAPEMRSEHLLFNFAEGKDPEEVKKAVKNRIKKVSGCKVYTDISQFPITQYFNVNNDFNINKWDASEGEFSTMKDDLFYDLLTKNKKAIYLDGFYGGFKYTNNLCSSNGGESKFKIDSFISDDNIIFLKVEKTSTHYHENVNVKDKNYLKYNKDYKFEGDEICNKFKKVSLYALVQGDISRYISLFRYSSRGQKRNNIFFPNNEENDFKKSILGESSRCVRFHFQNEYDNILQTGRVDSDKFIDKKVYMNGRSNSIDVEHLIEYLKLLDSLSVSELKEHNEYKLGMPFMDIIVNGKESGKEYFECKTASEIFTYFSSNIRQEDKVYVKYLKSLYKDYLKTVWKEEDTNTYFTKFIGKLRLLEVVAVHKFLSSDSYGLQKEKFNVLRDLMESEIIGNLMEEMFQLSKEDFMEYDKRNREENTKEIQ